MQDTSSLRSAVSRKDGSIFSSFSNAVPVSGGFVVRHGKKMLEKKGNPSQNVCLHNGQPNDSQNTTFYTSYFDNSEQEKICSELCNNSCRKVH